MAETQKPVCIVTGVCGFIGRRTAHRLLRWGAIVLGVDPFGVVPEELLSFQKENRFVFIPTGFSLAIQDLKAFLDKTPEQDRVLIHLAGIADVEACIADPAKAYKINVHLTWKVARFCAQTGISRCLLASTGILYGSSDKARLAKETDFLRPDSVYTATKIAAEHILSVLAQEHEFKGIIMRFSNVYGNGSSENTVLGTIIRQVRKGITISVKDPMPVRDFVHIDDVADAIVLLASKPLPDKVTIVNIGTGIGTSIGALVGMAEQFTGTPPSLQRFGSGSSLVLDISKVFELTGWTPRISIENGLKIILSTKDD